MNTRYLFLVPKPTQVKGVRKKSLFEREIETGCEAGRVQFTLPHATNLFKQQFVFFLRYTEFEGSLKIMTWNLFSGDEQNVERIDSWVKRRRHVCDFINSLKPDVSNFSIFSSFSFFKSKYLMTEHKIYNQKIFIVAWITFGNVLRYTSLIIKWIDLFQLYSSDV